MKITVDTNVLVRVAVQDHPQQSALAATAMQQASLVAVPLPVMCEFVWALRRGYKLSAALSAEAVQRLIKCENVVTNRAAVEAGLSVLAAGGDFADGVIAYEGNRSGAQDFVSFDKKAVSILQPQRHSARLLSE